MDLEEVRWKLAEELEPDEVTFLRDNKDKLNEEELDAFKEVLKDPEEEPVVEEEASGKEEEEGEEAEVVAKEGEEEKPPANYLTKEEADTFVKKAIEDREAAKKEAGEGTKGEQAAKKEILKLFEDGYKAQDANEFANKLIEVLTPILTTKTVESIQQMSTEQRKQFDSANSRLDAEYTEIAKKNKLPDLTTEEGQTTNSQLATIAAKYNMDNYFDAYELWSKIPAKFGGGLSVEEAEKTEKKEALGKQKKAASMVGKGGGEGVVVKDKNAGPTREDIATNSMDALLERAMS